MLAHARALLLRSNGALGTAKNARFYPGKGSPPPDSVATRSPAAVLCPQTAISAPPWQAISPGLAVCRDLGAAALAQKGVCDPALVQKALW
jgi:hypothetical protein